MLKIEAGKYYRTRDGRKVFVIQSGPWPGQEMIFPVAGWLEGAKALKHWSCDGTYTNHPTEHDLVEEWKEPASGMAYLRRDATGEVYITSSRTGTGEVIGSARLVEGKFE
jgi:hypothetical protein